MSSAQLFADSMASRLNPKRLQSRPHCLPGKKQKDVWLQATTNSWADTVIVWAGTNDVYTRDEETRRPSRETKSGRLVAMETLEHVQRFRLRHPTKKLVVVGMLPRMVGSRFVHPHASAHALAQFAEFNSYLGVALSEQQIPGTCFLDIASLLDESGVGEDGLHPSRLGNLRLEIIFDQLIISLLTP